MSARSILLWSLAGFLGLTALTMLVTPEPKVFTLERGLGPAVETTQL